ncbi:N-carbamoylputrescine amidase [Marinomonas sp. 15G1-11]|uniref:N-carbamoylputrescine amidase n=1 Tax=Marinomonas phaeophyticola TaxID=3004091 RepID=A0ABT4JYC4_9GAMM|nr:N-carbamoylputrescine amidase [Marinomonas sp. 15G1-11]MCZ2723387.1 N-carbamoylputrescine amidase [Marinomonas sp. 15G1-11]
MNSLVKVACIQMAVGDNKANNITKAESKVREAANNGANIILLQELFAGFYFCIDQKPEFFDWAESLKESDVVARMSLLAKELSVVLPVSFFEKDGQSFYNSLVVIDADGSVLDLYRKTHIPDGPGYQEKYYFTPGNTGIKVWDTQFGRIGCGICWDQWFPELARTLALNGAELIFYPTAIGSEPPYPDLDSKDHWQRTMQGHAAANMTPVIASNRVGKEFGENSFIEFYGSSFMTNETGEKIAEANRTEETILYASYDLKAIRHERRAFGLFRDRRPEKYNAVVSGAGQTWDK